MTLSSLTFKYLIDLNKTFCDVEINNALNKIIQESSTAPPTVSSVHNNYPKPNQQETSNKIAFPVGDRPTLKLPAEKLSYDIKCLRPNHTNMTLTKGRT